MASEETRDRFVLWDVEEAKFNTVEKLPSDADSTDWLNYYYGLLKCHTIDVTQRKIGKYVYDIIVDDEGLLKSDHIISLWHGLRPDLVGNLLFCMGTADGDLIPLTPLQIKNLFDNVNLIGYFDDRDHFHVGVAYE